MNIVRSLMSLLLFVHLVAWTKADEEPPRATFEQAPIATATPKSTTFVLVNSSECDPQSIATIYKLYERNMMVFQTCVDDSAYQIFPFSGTFPTPEQIKNMATSLACRALFSSALLAGLPECNMAGFPIRAAAETQLKVTVDVKDHPMNPNVIPSTERFVDMMYWRRNVNLAEDAGLPCDSKSKLYSEFASNLYTLTTDGLVRLSTGMKVEYRPTVDSPFSQEMIMALPELPLVRGSWSTEDSVGSSSASSFGDTITPENPQTVPGVPPANDVTSNAAESLRWSNSELVAAILAVAAFVMVYCGVLEVLM